MKTQESNDIVYEQNQEHHKLPTNENIEDEYDGHKLHSHE